jgi:hypothetical protein
MTKEQRDEEARKERIRDIEAEKETKERKNARREEVDGQPKPEPTDPADAGHFTL